MKLTMRYMHNAISADARARVGVSETPATWYFATEINGQRPKAPPS